jgi:hypothetical protein
MQTTVLPSTENIEMYEIQWAKTLKMPQTGGAVILCI